MIPKTYLLTAPSDALDPLGRSMSHTEVIRLLKLANPSLYIPTEGWQTWGKDLTSIWTGVPLQPGSKKICAFRLGMIPEFTQIGPDSRVIARGWRAILERVVAMRAAKRTDLERLFNVTMGFDGRDKNCYRCRRFGVVAPSDSPGGMCKLHDGMERWAHRQRQAVLTLGGSK